MEGAPSKSQMQERNVWDVEKRNIVRVWRDAMRKAKTHLELSLAQDIKDNKKGFSK